MRFGSPLLPLFFAVFRCQLLRDDLDDESKVAETDLAQSDEGLTAAIAMVDALDNRAVHEFRTTPTPGNDAVVVMGAVIAILSGVMPGVLWTSGSSHGGECRLIVHAALGPVS